LTSADPTPTSDDDDTPASESEEPTILAQLLRLAVPLALSQLGWATMSLVDTAFVGRRSAADLAGVSLGSAVFFVLSVLAMGAVYGIEPLVAQAVGAGDPARARRALRRGLLLSVAASIIGGALIVVAIFALPSSGVKAEILPPAADYLWGRLPGLPAMLIVIAQRGYLQGHNITRPVVVSVLIANLLNVPADALLIHGDDTLAWLGLEAAGLPALGAGGAGIASALAVWVQVAVMWPAISRLDAGPEATAKERWRAAAQWSGIARALRIGMPMGAQFAGEVAFFSSVSFLMGGIGTELLAAHQVAITIASVPFHACMGIGSATAVIVGQRIGRRDQAGALRGGMTGIGVGVVFQVVVGATFLAFPELYLRAFTDEAEVIRNGATLVRIAGFFSISDGVQAVAAGALRGAGDTTWPFVFHLVAHWVFGMPTALLLGFTLGFGAPGLWWGLTCGLTVSAVALSTRFVRKARRGYSALETAGT